MKLEVDRFDFRSIGIHLVECSVRVLSVANISAEEDLFRILRPGDVAPVVDRIRRGFLFVDVLLFCGLWVDDRDGVLHEVIADPGDGEFGSIWRPGKALQPHVTWEVLDELDHSSVGRDNTNLVINRGVSIPHSGDRNHRRAVLREVHHLVASHFATVTPNQAEMLAGRGELELLNAGSRLAEVGQLLGESGLSIHSEHVGSV